MFDEIETSTNLTLLKYLLPPIQEYSRIYFYAIIQPSPNKSVVNSETARRAAALGVNASHRLA